MKQVNRGTFYITDIKTNINRMVSKWIALQYKEK